jgi:hypothetical protein
MDSGRRLNALLFAALALTALLSGCGCFRAGELARLPRELEDRVPGARLEREMALSLGPGSLGTARLAMALVPGNGDLRGTLADLHRVRVAVYRFQSPTGVDATTVQRQLESLLAAERWETVVRSREDEEGAWVLCRTDQEEIREICVVSLESDELVQVRLEGNLGRFIANAVRQRDDLAPSRLAEPYRPLITSRWPADPEGPRVWYDRVQGLHLGWAWSRDRSSAPGLRPYGELGYGLGSGTWSGRAGVESPGFVLPLGPPALRLAVGAELHDLTDTQDGWVISDEENTLAALLLRRDYRDYYRRTGGSGYLRGTFGAWAEVAVSLTADELSALENQVGWGLFSSGPARPAFRTNPAADELHVRGVAAEVRLGTRGTARRGWRTVLQTERNGGVFGGDNAFRRYLADVRRYQPLGGWGRVDLRARLGAAQGQVPSQYLFALGGYSSLRGYPFKAYPGDRMVLFTAEYWLDYGAESRSLPVLGGFVDTGASWFGGSRLLTGDRDPDLRTSIGPALAWKGLRLYLARPLDLPSPGWGLTFRLSDTF